MKFWTLYNIFTKGKLSWIVLINFNCQSDCLAQDHHSTRIHWPVTVSVRAFARALLWQEECSRGQMPPDNIQGSDKSPLPVSWHYDSPGIELSPVSGCRQVSGLSGMSRLSSWQQHRQLCACVTLKSTETSDHVTMNCSSLELERLTRLFACKISDYINLSPS